LHEAPGDVRSDVRVSLRHLDGGVAEHLAHDGERDALPHQLGCGRVAELVPGDPPDPSTLAGFSGKHPFFLTLKSRVSAALFFIAQTLFRFVRS